MYGSFSRTPFYLEGLICMEGTKTTCKGKIVNHTKTSNLLLFFFQCVYESKFPFFDFDSDMDAWTVARAFAKEPWSREYFDGIRK